MLVVGGGIHGAGIAQAAAASGVGTLMIERSKLASGTSSQSTKLIHGGLRYLEQARLGLVYESLAEREILLAIAPGLVQRTWFHIPVYKDGRRPPWMIHAGLALYWLLAGGKSRCRRIRKREWEHTLPGLSTAALSALFAYEDAATDDAALTRAVAASAASLGAEIREYTRLVSASRDKGGWRARIEPGGELTARVLVNAAGPWINHVAATMSPQPPLLSVQLVQGSHLLLPRPCPGFVYLEAPDRRAVFVRPWRGQTLVGTTETPHHGDPDTARPTPAEIAYLLAMFNHRFPELACKEEDIAATLCGLRVLPAGEKDAFSASRETVLLCDDRRRPTYIAVYGGKLTTYRRTAEKVAALIGRMLPPTRNVDTTRLPLAGS